MSSLEILTPLQKKFLTLVFQDKWFRRHFYLTGGTALATFFLYHRYSDDLDFFCHNQELTPIPNLFDAIAKRLGVKLERVQTSPGFQRFMASKGLKIDVVSDVAWRWGIPELRESFMIDNLKNIAINKVGAILGRLDAKDYIDLYLILKREKWDIFELITLAQKKDGGLEPFAWAGIIADAERLAVLPRMIAPLDLAHLKSFYRDLRNRILDRINPKRR